jgi:hypothetical protein
VCGPPGDGDELGAPRADGDPAVGREFGSAPVGASDVPDVDEDEDHVYPPISALDGHLGDDGPVLGDSGHAVDHPAGPVNGLDDAADDGGEGGADDDDDDDVDVGDVGDDPPADDSDGGGRQPDRKKPRLGGTP